MKRGKLLAVASAITLIIGILGACSDTSIDGDTGTSKSSSSSPSKKDDSSSKKSNDIWTYYNGTTWSNDYQGFKTTIEKVVVSDEAPANDGSDKKMSAVGVKFKLENTTKSKFTTYPDQAVLVTSTGEQIEMPEMLGSDNLGGEIDEGVNREGDVVWYLKNKVKDIKWIKLKWTIHKGAEDQLDAPTHDYEVKLELKK